RIVKIAFFSTDWQFQPVPDHEKSIRSGRSEYVKGKKLATFGGTYWYRMAMPAEALTKYAGIETVLSPMVRNVPETGEIHVMDPHGVWHTDCDVVVFQRWMHEDGVDRAMRARACGQVVINDVDDNFWHLPKSN